MNRTSKKIQIMESHNGNSVEGILEKSPDMRHVARGFQKFDKQYVKCDEVMGGYYDKIVPPLIFSPDGNRLAYNAITDRQIYVIIDQKEYGPFEDITENGPYFSPDSQHVAFGFKSNGEWFYHVDGSMQGPFKGVGVGIFSLDSQQFGFKAIVVKEEKQTNVLNGFPGQLFDHVDNPRFSPDSKRCAYAAKKGSEWCVVLDGQPGKYFVQTHIQLNPFSPDSQHFGYTVIERNKYSIVVDDKLHGSYNRLTEQGFVFSPDSKLCAWVFQKDKYHYIYLDGQMLGPFDDAGEFVFSPNSKRFSFIRKDKKKKFGILPHHEWFMVLDGMDSRSYPYVSQGVFSPNSQRFAFSAVNKGMWFPVIDGVEGSTYENLGQVIFSPDSQKVAYAAIKHKKWVIIIDGKEFGLFDNVIDSQFSPDSRCFAFMGSEKGGSSVYINGMPGEQFEVIIPREDKVVEFDSLNQFHYLAIEDSSIVLVNETIHWDEDG